MSLRLAALNLASPTPRSAQAQLAWLAGLDVDLLVLSELSSGPGSMQLLRTLRASGHDVLASAPGPGGLGVALAGRGLELEPLPAPDEPVLPGRVLLARVGSLAIAGVYGAASDPVRYSSARQRARKRDWLAWFEQWLATAPVDVVAGDLNIADPLVAEGLRHVLAEETALYARLVTGGWTDAYRLHQLDGSEPSWVDHSGPGARYDHALVRDELAGRVAECRLDPSSRAAGLSDHAALLLELD